MHADTLGDRIRHARQLAGLTQSELARASGVSLSLVRKLEQGAVVDTRAATARKLASALGIPTTALLETEREWVPAVDTAEMWAPVVRAISAPLPALDDAPDADGTARAVRAAIDLQRARRYTEFAAVVPTVLRDARHVAADDPHDGRPLIAEIMQAVGSALVQHRQFDGADRALGIAIDHAADGPQAAAAVNTRCWLLLRRGRLADAEAEALRWADDTEPRRLSRATPGQVSAWGWLLLRAAAAAGRNARPGEASTALRLAAAAAAVTGREAPMDRDPLRRAYGPVTVARKRAEDAAISGRPDRVLALTAGIPYADTTDHRRHMLDVAHAHAELRQPNDAMATLTHLHSTSPEWLAQQRYAGDVLTAVISRRRTLTDEMRQLAAALSLTV
ncbi:helix-turn-helix domain-containing protein [Streptomyces otsuchiensis]|uniref:helix-turn-helix domain-containing protein n=1 Tax=Streptomyces otsuchiensis TaxID=2681388 RepID=UPI0010308BCC|nr:helix-turn-helix transcriptional regulator [Streptomyces otsuchiensis]